MDLKGQGHEIELIILTKLDTQYPGLNKNIYWFLDF
jgi:hypothetical protein